MWGGSQQTGCLQPVPGPTTPSCSTSLPNCSLSPTCCGLSQPVVWHVLASPSLPVWLASRQEWGSGKKMGFAGPGDQGPVCLGKQGSKLTLSRPDSRRAELRVPQGPGGDRGLGVGGQWRGRTMQTVWAAEELAAQGPAWRGQLWRRLVLQTILGSCWMGETGMLWATALAH